MQNTLSALGVAELTATEMNATNGGNTVDPLITIIKQLLSGGGESGTISRE